MPTESKVAAEVQLPLGTHVTIHQVSRVEVASTGRSLQRPVLINDKLLDRGDAIEYADNTPYEGVSVRTPLGPALLHVWPDRFGRAPKVRVESGPVPYRR